MKKTIHRKIIKTAKTFNLQMYRSYYMRSISSRWINSIGIKRGVVQTATNFDSVEVRMMKIYVSPLIKI